MRPSTPQPTPPSTEGRRPVRHGGVAREHAARKPPPAAHTAARWRRHCGTCSATCRCRRARPGRWRIRWRGHWPGARCCSRCSCRWRYGGTRRVSDERPRHRADAGGCPCEDAGWDRGRQGEGRCRGPAGQGLVPWGRRAGGRRAGTGGTVRRGRYRLPNRERRSRRSGAKSETRLARARAPLVPWCALSRAVSSRMSDVASAVSRCGTAGPARTERWRSRRELLALLPQVIAGTLALLRTVICSMSLPTRTTPPGPGRVTLSPHTGTRVSRSQDSPSP